MQHLYYAGMARDGIAEQIGLAVSADGRRFERVNGDGLIVRRDPRIAWKDTRVCNPAVLRDGDGFVLYYHGAQGTAAGRTITHTIGLGFSRDGIAWDVPDEPLLSWRDMVAIDPAAASGKGIGLIEPCLVRDGSGWRMWFVYASTTFPGNALFTATSADGRRFVIDPQPVLRGADLGNRSVHYPQVVGGVLWLTVHDHGSGAYAILRRDLASGATAQVLEPSARIDVRAWRAGPLPVRVSRGLSRVLHGGRHYLGYAHPHVIGDALWYHGYHLRGRTTWMDIGRCRLVDGRPVGHERMLDVAAAPDAWDAAFVADPFVLEA